MAQVVADAHALNAGLNIGECVFTLSLGVECGVNRQCGFYGSSIQTKFSHPFIGQHGDFFPWGVERGHARDCMRVGNIVTVDRQ